jgi:hypothetical protein
VLVPAALQSLRGQAARLAVSKTMCRRGPLLRRDLRNLAPAPGPHAPIPPPARASRSGEGEPEAREKRSALPTFGDKTSAPRSPSTRRPSAPPDRPASTPIVPTPAPTSRSP